MCLCTTQEEGSAVHGRHRPLCHLDLLDPALSANVVWSWSWSRMMVVELMLDVSTRTSIPKDESAMISRKVLDIVTAD